jgi:2-C-methyl-D-erythritol 4-phosphate cytidylyltransferase/2-C-methyl-D-erythritol 2,4-cyclodiphosphate synthase
MSLKDNIAVIIPAAGSSSRFGGLTPKQYLRIGDETVLEKSVNLFLEISSIKKVYLAIDPNEPLIRYQSFYNDPKVNIVKGGNTRTESVFNALSVLDKDIDIVAIHDAVRPWLSKTHFEDLLSKLVNEKSIQGVYPVISITDSLRMKRSKDLIPVEREDFLSVQTPQLFYKKSLKKALDKLKQENFHLSDETQAMEKAGFKVLAIPGERSNLKITFSDDMPDHVETDYRIGRGIDFHQLESGNGLTLGNIFIDCNLSIVAHSDGDIVLHAISDALLGAGGLRDIGYYFPDTDSKNKNLSSLKIIEKSLDLLKEQGLQPRNIDFVVVCEQPKIGPYIDKLKKSLSRILNIEENLIGVKATTAEGMGAIGEGNGIAVYAIASLRNLQ